MAAACGPRVGGGRTVRWCGRAGWCGGVNGGPLNEEGLDCIEGRLFLFLSDFVECFEDGVVEEPPLQQGVFVFGHRNRGVFADLPVNIVGRSHELDVGSFDEVEAVPHVDDCPDDCRLFDSTCLFVVFGPTQSSRGTFLPKVDTWTKPVMLFQAGVRSFGPVHEALSNRPIQPWYPSTRFRETVIGTRVSTGRGHREDR